MYNFEQGPIRPPSEANSLLIRISRNCPWNKCSFCTVYKGSNFSIRLLEDIKRDIDSIKYYTKKIDKIIMTSGNEDNIRKNLRNFEKLLNSKDVWSYNIVLNWFVMGTRNIFLQDANSLIVKSSKLIEIIKYIKKKLIWVSRITSYARSHTISKIDEDNLRNIYIAGLNRIHIGMESGSDKVLNMINKGCNKRIHIEAGLSTKKVGIELSEYVMPGLGGKNFSREHAIETADAINDINPDFIRLRTLHIPKSNRLFFDHKIVGFNKCSAIDIASEIKLLIQNLKGISSKIVSDHVYNFFDEVNGKLPEEKNKMISKLNQFINLSPYKQHLFQMGKKVGIVQKINDMKSESIITKIDKFCKEKGFNERNIKNILDTNFSI